MEKELSTIIMILILLSVLGVSPIGLEASSSQTYENSEVESKVISNISIEGDEDLKNFASEENYDLLGNGTEENPFLLENYTIDGMGENHAVFLDDIELHFVIRDCKIYNSSDSGIKINQVSNFTLENSVVKNSTYGINIGESSHNITIRESKVYHTTANGISIESSENITLKESNIRTTDGVNIESSENIKIKECSIHDNERGIYLREGANNNTITNNNISNNNGFGVHISESNHNFIYHNIFFENVKQAGDDGNNLWDRGDPRDEGEGGNYWSDYDLGDRGDGIGNKSYEIDGDDNEDRYPLISPIGPPTNVRTRPVRDEYIELTWNRPRYSIRYPVEEIIIYRGKERENLSVYEKVNSSVREFRDENVTETETYHYALLASNEKYVSIMSGILSAQPETTRPKVEYHYPMKDDEEVPINATVKIEFSEEMKANSIQVSIEDVEEGEDIKLEEVDEDPENIEFNFKPKECLSYETRYEVTVNGSDKASNWLESPYTWTFTTVSDTGIIIGRVVNEEEDPLNDVEISVDEQNQALTDSFGEFQIEVPSGNVTLEVSREGYENKEIDIYINQSEEKEIEDIVLKEREGIISRWFWPMALAGGGILILGIIALFISFYNWEEEEPPSDEDLDDLDYEEVSAEEFESWWEDKDS